jgi:RpiR family carbohydrate utilization transcriptional regulator
MSPSPAFDVRLGAAGPTLGPAERRIAQVLADHLAELPELSTAQVADLAGASRASVVRTCQRLGYTGYQQLRVLAVREAATGPAGLTAAAGTADAAAAVGGADARPAAGQRTGTSGAVVDTARSLAQQVTGSLGLLDEQALADTVEDLARADRVLILAAGLSTSVGQSLYARLLRLGTTVLSPTDPMDTEILASTLSSDDLCVAISGSGVNAQTLRAARAAAEAGAGTVGLTSFAGTPLEQIVARIHVTPVPHRHYQDEFRGPSRLAQHLLVEAIAEALARRSDRRPGPSQDRILEVVSAHVDE